ncbi:TPA: DUF4357 domain-containing protein [Photobacterium damselae]
MANLVIKLDIRTIICSLGHKLLEPRVSQTASPQANQQENIVLQLKVKKVDAKAMLTDEGIVVLKGSQALATVQPSLSKGYTKLRSNLEEKCVLTPAPSGDRLIAAEDILFTSASQASAILLGYPCGGPDYWRDSSGKTLKDIEAESV